MEFLQPILLWGLLGLSVPILIHLWNGKKGKLVAWAAMHWLQEQENQSSKSIRIDQILILILRMLLILLLVFLLAQMLLKGLGKPETGEVIHLVQPDKKVIEDFKFELEQAMEKGEKVILTDSVLTVIESLDGLNQIVLNQSDKIQESLNDLPENTEKLYLYLSNSDRLISSEFLYSPVKPVLFLSENQEEKEAVEFIRSSSGTVGFVNREGQLAFSDQLPNPAAKAVWEGEEISWFSADLLDSEQGYLEASLSAISDVFPLNFESSENRDDAILVFMNQYPDSVDSKKLYFLTNHRGLSNHENVVALSGSINSTQSELVQTGKLPELILENLMLHLGLKRMEMPLSQTQFQSRFLISDPEKAGDEGNMQTILLALLVLTFAAERVLSQQRGI
ncbi:MAG: BatA domain-containing protein [Algoriphagus sp.]|nr:BatA domain-containing protein [Algoriphagus sp.]